MNDVTFKQYYTVVAAVATIMARTGETTVPVSEVREEIIKQRLNLSEGHIAALCDNEGTLLKATQRNTYYWFLSFVHPN